MATGDILVFDEAKLALANGAYAASDSIKVALFTASYTPTVADASPVYAATNEVTAAGTYVVGGLVLDTLTNMCTEVGGVMTFDDTGAFVEWLADASNGTDASWALIYNLTASNQAIAFVELGAVNMVTGKLTITWPAGGIFTIT